MDTAPKMLSRVRLNVDELLDLFAQCAAGELAIFYYYTVFSSRLIEIGGARLQEVIEKARLEDCHHFEQLVLLIYEMGGECPLDFRKLPQFSATYSRFISSWDPSDERTILKILIEAEEAAVQTYSDICSLIEEKNGHTHHLISSVLEEELRHRHELRSFLSSYSVKKNLFLLG